MSIKSFDEYFEGYGRRKAIIADAKKIFETLKTPEEIEQFQKADYEKQQKMVKGLDEEHDDFTFNRACSFAHEYALYKAKEAPYTCDEYFAGYKNYDNGGKLDQIIVADAKKVYETLKTPEAIKQFAEASTKKQEEMVKGLDEEHSVFSFACVCYNAYKYATYAQKYVKENTAQENNSGEAKDNELARLKKLVESRKMTNDIKRGMDKSTPIKQDDANASFNVLAAKRLKTNER